MPRVMCKFIVMRIGRDNTVAFGSEVIADPGGESLRSDPRCPGQSLQGQ